MKTIIIIFCLLLSIGAYASGDMQTLRDMDAIQQEYQRIQSNLNDLDRRFNQAMLKLYDMQSEKRNLEQNLNQCIQQLNRQNSQQ